jgi:hypothetical protein
MSNGNDKKAISVQPGEYEELKVKPGEYEEEDSSRGTSSASMAGQPDYQEDKPWYKDIADVFMGGGKYLAEMGEGLSEDLPFPTISPRSMASIAAGSDVPKDVFERKNIFEDIGAFGAEAGSYALPIKGEQAAGRFLSNVVKKGYRPMRGARLPVPAARAAIGVGDTAAKTATAAASGALSAEANQEDPVKGALINSFFPATAALSKNIGLSGVVSDQLTDWAKSDIAKAINPSLWYDKWAANKVLGPLLESGKTWFTSKGLAKRAMTNVREAAERQKAIAPGEDALVPFDEALQLMQAERDKVFRPGKSGAQMVGGQIDRSSEIPVALGPEAEKAAQEFDSWVNDYFVDKTVTDPRTGERFIPFDELNKLKKYAQDTAAESNLFSGAIDVTAGPRAKAYKTASNAIRPQLEEFAGEGWAKENEVMSIWLDIYKLAKSGDIKSLGKSTSYAERPILGFGAHMGGGMPVDRSTLIRSLRYLTDTPAWNSLMAQAKYNVAQFIAKNSGYKVGQVMEFLANRGGKPESERVEPGTKVSLPDPLGIR